MKSDSNSDNVPMMDKVAFLSSKGYKQQAIADMLGSNQSTVQRELDKAKSKGLVRVEYGGDHGATLNAVFGGNEDLKELITRAASLLKWKPHLKSVKVFPSELEAPAYIDYKMGVKATSADEWDRAILKWRNFAAQDKTLTRTIANAKRVGVTWGRAIRAYVDGVEAEKEASVGRSRNASHSPNFFPLWGNRIISEPQSDDRIFSDHKKLSSNSLAEDLEKLFNSARPGEQIQTPSLPCEDFIPFIPEDWHFAPGEEAFLFPFNAHLNEHELAAEKQWIEQQIHYKNLLPSYRSIFGGKDDPNYATPIIDSLDCIITAIGATGTGRNLGRTEESYGGVPYHWIHQHMIGDIGGMWLPKLTSDKQDEKVRQQMHRLNLHWTGIRERHFKGVSNHGNPGTIVFAVGYDRALVILRCLEQGLINHLVTDTTLASYLKIMIEEKLRQEQ